jgi:hypothetical protein
MELGGSLAPVVLTVDVTALLVAVLLARARRARHDALPSIRADSLAIAGIVLTLIGLVLYAS